MRVLVVTDRYPPDREGGAELSLQTSLAHLPQGVEVQVAALCSTSPVIERAVVDGIPVARIPFSRVWPPHLNIPVGSLSEPAGMLAKLRAACRYVLAGGIKNMASNLSWVRIYAELLFRGNARLFGSLDTDLVAYGPTAKMLGQLAAEVKPDVIHADNLMSGLLVAAMALPVPKCVFVRDNRFFCAQARGAANIEGVSCTTCQFDCLGPLANRTRHLLRKNMSANRESRKIALREFDSVVVASRWMENQVRQLASDRQEVHVVPNPRNEALLAEATKTEGERPAVQPPEVLFVGALYEEKGPLILVELMPELIKEIGNFRLVLAGSGPLEAAIRKRISELELESAVELAGFCSPQQLCTLYRRSTLVVCPSTYPEPFGRVPFEAAIFSRPVVAFQTGGLSENIVDGETGILVPSPSTAELGHAITKLLGDPDRAGRLGRNAARRLRDSDIYRPEANASGLAAVWESTRTQGVA